MNYFRVLLLILYIDGLKRSVVAYEVDPPVHPWISYQAALFWPGPPTNLPGESWAEMKSFVFDGDAAGLEGLFSIKPVIPPHWGNASMERLSILRGSYDEDGGNVDPNAPLNHFWNSDLRYDSGLLFNAFGYDSALQRANTLWKQALCIYENDKAQAYYLLGRVVHLLQDLSVPAHSHLDPHLGRHLTFPVIGEFNTGDDSTYESFTAFEQNYQQCINCTARGVNRIQGRLSEIPTRLQMPPEYDYALSRIFYNISKLARRFDSDCPDCDGNDLGASLRADLVNIPRGTRKLRSLEFNQGRPVKEGSVSVYIPRPLGQDFILIPERDFTESAWRGRVLLSDTIEIGQHEWLIVDFVDRYSGVSKFETVFDLIESGDIPDSDTRVAQEVLEGAAIYATAQVYLLFWVQTHSKAPGLSTLLISNCYIYGGDGDRVALSNVNGADGGAIDIRTAVNSDYLKLLVPGGLGTGINGDLIANSVSLESGVYQYRQVRPDGPRGDPTAKLEISIVGNVTILCQYGFRASRIVGLYQEDGTPPSLTIVSGANIFFYTNTTGIEYSDNYSIGIFGGPGYDFSRDVDPGGVYFSPGGTADWPGWDKPIPNYGADGHGLRGGTLRFYTTAKAEPKCPRMHVNGGNGFAGGHGGHGGNVTILADSIDIGEIFIFGGDGGWGCPSLYEESECEFEQGHAGGNGGSGGTVQLKSNADYPPNPFIDGRGGSGGDASYGPGQEEDGKSGGHGGSGGIIQLELDPIEKAGGYKFVEAILDGGDGGKGSNADQEFKSEYGLTGGDGGHGGDPGLITLRNSSIGLISSRGGSGGNGGVGGPSHSPEGGRGGNGGNAVGTSVGRGGQGGLGTKHAGPSGNYGLQVSPRLRKLLSIPKNPSFCDLSASDGIPFRIERANFDSHGKFQVTLSTIAKLEEYVIQRSFDLYKWTNIHKSSSSNNSIEFTDPESIQNSRSFYRILVP